MSLLPAAAGIGMGLLLEGHQDRRQLKQQGKLTQQQLAAQKELNKYNQDLQFDMWQKTNFKAQKEQLKAAGLNPGLLYGMGGAGGATTGSSGGSVSGGTAAGQSGEAMGMMHGGIQATLLEAQRDLINAQTEKTKVETEKTAGVDTELAGAQIKGLSAGVENTEAKTRLTKIESEIQELNLEMSGETYNARKHMIKYETDIKLNQLNILKNDSLISDNTWSEKIQIVSAELVGMGIRNELSKAQTEKTWSDIQVNNQQIQNWLVQNAQGWERLSQQERETKITELLGEFNTSLSREALGALGGIISTVIGKGMSKGTIINKKTINLPQGTKGFGGE